MERIAWLECIISLANIYVILTRLFSGRINRRRLLFCLIVIILPCMVLSSVYPDTVLGYSKGFLCILLTLTVPVLTIGNLKKSYAIYTAFFYAGASGALIVSLVWIARSLQLNEFVFNAVDIAFHCFILTMLVLMSKGRIFNKFPRQIELLPRYLKIILLVFVWFSDFLAYFLSSFFYDYPQSPRLTVIQCLAASLIILVGLLWPILITNSMTNLHYKNVVDNIERQMDDQVRRYEQTIKTNTDIRKLRHDFKNLRFGLMDFLKAGNTKEALGYLDEFDTPVVSEYILFETGNPVADALLSEKHARALSINAKIVFDGLMPNDQIAHADICIILGNALDNVLEACSKIPGDEEKKIFVSSSINNGFLFISIQNPVFVDVKIINNSVETTKQDKESHGFGIYSISRAIKKYNGRMTLSCENKTFCLKIDLDLNGRIVT